MCFTILFFNNWKTSYRSVPQYMKLSNLHCKGAKTPMLLSFLIPEWSICSQVPPPLPPGQMLLSQPRNFARYNVWGKFSQVAIIPLSVHSIPIKSLCTLPVFYLFLQYPSTQVLSYQHVVRVSSVDLRWRPPLAVHAKYFVGAFLLSPVRIVIVTGIW